MIADPAPMLSPERLHPRAVEESVLLHLTLIEQLVRPGLERASQPESDRAGESLLRAVDELTRHVAIEKTAQQALVLPPAAIFERRRQPPGVFDDAVVQERHPHFEAVGHARP